MREQPDLIRGQGRLPGGSATQATSGELKRRWEIKDKVKTQMCPLGTSDLRRHEQERGVGGLAPDLDIGSVSMWEDPKTLLAPILFLAFDGELPSDPNRA